jgi:hypothetical protein
MDGCVTSQCGCGGKSRGLVSLGVDSGKSHSVLLCLAVLGEKVNGDEDRKKDYVSSLPIYKL